MMEKKTTSMFTEAEVFMGKPIGKIIKERKGKAVSDDLWEFEEALSEIKKLRQISLGSSSLEGDAKALAYDVAIIKLKFAISKWRKRHTEQNRPLSIDFGELAPEILKIQCGFGEK